MPRARQKAQLQAPAIRAIAKRLALGTQEHKLTTCGPTFRNEVATTTAHYRPHGPIPMRVS